MSDFWFYFTIGWQHIISLDALDHQLFILALAILYTFNDWKRVLVLVTAFTIGHSITLALSVFQIITVPSPLIEFFIPCTIFITAVVNICKPRLQHKGLPLSYLFALFFGLIHGLGFANALKYMLASDQSLGRALLAFNLGLEAGQIAVVLLVLALTYLVNRLPVKITYWVISISFLVLIISVKMMIERFPN